MSGTQTQQAAPAEFAAFLARSLSELMAVAQMLEARALSAETKVAELQAALDTKGAVS